MNNRKIALITEDEKEFGERCRVCLEEKGFEVEYTPRNGKELLRKIRMNKARELLTATDRSISEIAYEVGFSSPAYFTRVYREMFNETPSELRERLGH